MGHSIAIVGGTGTEGSGLSLRWANAGHRVIIGSRDPVKAQAVADEFNRTLGTKMASGAASDHAVEAADIVGSGAWLLNNSLLLQRPAEMNSPVLDSAWVGGTLRRRVYAENDDIILFTEPQMQDGVETVIKLVWHTRLQEQRQQLGVNTSR
jgi:NAD(P)-dependent dehydrogenase (short-subunit alcohol dehydrogenase family)